MAVKRKPAGFGGILDRREEKAQQEKTRRRRGPRLQGDCDERTALLLVEAAHELGRDHGDVLSEALLAWFKALPAAERKRIEEAVERKLSR